jgi:membrane-associated protein
MTFLTRKPRCQERTLGTGSRRIIVYGLGIDPKHLIEAFGTIGIFAIVFAESGLLIGFFLPGDSLLFTAGLLAAKGTLNLPVLLVGCFVAAVAGDQVGFTLGRKCGPAIFRRPESRFFHQRNVDRARDYFEAHGPRTIVLARFVPIVRTFAPMVAGVAGMDRRLFSVYNVVGGFLWAVGVTSLGYVLGESIPDIDRYLLPVIGLIVFLSLLPVLLEVRKSRRATPQRGGGGGPSTGS